jgi:transcriptional regulator GlxA family with amidase domain
VLVSGGEERAIVAALEDEALVRWVARAAPVVRRIGSVCSGAFVLAAAGLLDGRRAATHWSACEALSKMRPAVTVDANAIFVKDGKVWTSAGVTTGIDMALAMVEEDFARKRTLHRRCQDVLGVTPAKLVEGLRVEHARTLLSTTTQSLKGIAYDSGFVSGERMRHAFERELGVGSRKVRLLFSRAS